jgi:hypothetical protein
MTQRYGRWEDAMIAQTALLEWTESRIGRKYLVSFFQDQNDKHTPKARRDVLSMCGLHHEMLVRAEPIYVSPDVTEVIDKARETWRPETLNPGDLFTQNGFLVFPRPILLDDMPPTKESPLRAIPPDGMLHGYIPLRAVSWMTIHSEDLSVGSVWISFFVAADDEYDLADKLGAPSRFETGPDGERIPRDEARKLMPMTMVHQWQWSWGTKGVAAEDWDNPERYDVMPEDSVDHMIARAKQQTALMQTIWRIASQLVAVKQRPQRQMWRDANRKGIAHKEVTVITLRRGRSGPYEETGRSLEVRFVVRGHWRNQPYGPRDDPYYRQIWIAPYVKGPEDAPLRLTTRAWEFVR